MEGGRERRRRREEKVGIGWSLWYSDKQDGGGVGEIKQVVI